MASTEEVLKALQNAKITTLAATEPEELVIDAESRTITVPSSERLFGVTGDMNIERKYFRCPKIVGDNVDLSTHQIFIAYVYTETESGSIFPSIGVAPYHCEDVEVDGEDITFSWKLTGNVFKNPGFILFKMYAKKTETDPNTVFNTTPAIGTVLATIPDGTEEIVEEHPDVIAQIFDRLDALESGGGTGGTTNYENLSNKPQLNGVTLEGNKTLDQVGVLAKNQGSNNSGKFLSVGSDGNVVPADAPSGGTVDPEQIKQAVNGYLEENPVSGMTAEQEQQLNQNASDIADLKSALTSATLGIENGLLYIFLNNQKVGEGISIGEINTPDIPIYEHVSWIDTAYGIGDNTIANYNAWAPGCAFYDSISKKVIFLQCHRSSHTGSWLKSQLWAIDPYNVMEGELLYEFDVDTYGNVPLAMTQDNGRIYIFSKNARWVSQDNGETFEKTNIVTKPDHMYGVSLIDGVMYAGDDASDTAYNGYYWTSNDYGLNWECHTFEFTEEYGDELFCCEANFIKFKGKIYASLRRQDKNGLMAVLEDGVWKVISEEMPNVNSDSYFSVTEDRLCYASIDRPNRILYLGTCIPNETGVDIKKEKNFIFSNFTSEGDFHTPTYIYGDNFQMVTFMTGIGHSDYQKCMNACVVGYSDMSLSENPNYEIDEFEYSTSNFTDEPYINSAITNQNFSVYPAVGNSVAHYANTWPLENSSIVFYFPVSSPIIGPDIYCSSNCYGYAIYDMVISDEKPYVCLVKGVGSTKALTGLKLMSKANKILYDISGIGEITPSNGKFDNAIYALSNSRFFAGNEYRMYAKIS